MKMKNCFLGTLLGLVLMLGFSVSAYAVDYDLWVGGERVTSENANDVFNDGKVSYSPGNPGTLTLNNYSYLGEGYLFLNLAEYKMGAGIYTDNSPLKIVLNGNNNIAVSGDGAAYFGIDINKDLLIEGSGSLNVSGEGGTASGIAAPPGNVTINSGKVTATGSDNGIYSNLNININGGTVIANGNTDDGIYAGKGLTISGGKVSATGNKHGINAGISSYYVNIVDDGTVIAAGGTKSINGLVHNTKIGTGWTDMGGTEGEDQISVSTGQNLSFRKVQFPDVLDPAVVTVAPEARILTYTGSAQELVTAGTTNDGTIQYVLGDNRTTAPTTGYTTSIPSGTNAGTYYVWFKAKGNTGYTDSTPACVQVTIGKAEPVVTAPTAKTLSYNGTVQELVTVGSASGGTMYYTFGTDATTAPSTGYNEYSYKAIDAGTYYVWYLVVGDKNHNNTAPACVTVTIAKVAQTVTAPTAKTLTYTGSAQELVSAGTATGGTMQYALGKDGTTAPTDGWGESIPTGTDAGTFYVWYMAEGDENYSDTVPACITVNIVQKETPTPSGGGGDSIPQTTDPAPAPNPTPSETTEQPAATESTITQDAFTGISETIETSADGTAVVTSVAGTTGKTLRITGTVNQGGTNYPVSSFATNAFSNVDVKNIFIDLKTSGNTQTVTFQPRTFKGSEAKKLTLRLSSSGQVKFSSGALSGSKIKKVVVSGLKKKEFKRVEKKLRKSGYKGKIVKK